MSNRNTAGMLACRRMDYSHMPMLTLHYLDAEEPEPVTTTRQYVQSVDDKIYCLTCNECCSSCVSETGCCCWFAGKVGSGDDFLSFFASFSWALSIDDERVTSSFVSDWLCELSVVRSTIISIDFITFFDATSSRSLLVVRFLWDLSTRHMSWFLNMVLKII